MTDSVALIHAESDSAYGALFPDLYPAACNRADRLDL